MSPNELIERLDCSALPVDWRLLVVDGDNGAGKSGLSNKLAELLNARVVSIDDALIGNGDIYWEQINYEKLRSEIEASGPKVILEGVCALKILERLGLTPDYLVFVKQYNGLLGWDYEQHLDENTGLPHSKLRQDIVQYYRLYRPFERCNVLLEDVV